MLFLLRKIRRKLLTNNKVTTYLLYAIGEIALVMIGILLALQVSDWSEKRKSELEELSLLSEIKSNLEATLVNFQNDTLYNNQTIRYYRQIELYMDKDLPYDQSLDSAMAAIPLFSSPFPINSAYKTLQTKGMDLLKNRALKERIQRLYDMELASLHMDVDQSEWSLHDNVLAPFFTKYFQIINEGSMNQARPNDFEALKKNSEFKNILSILIRTRIKGIFYYNNIMTSIDELIKDIDRELTTRN